MGQKSIGIMDKVWKKKRNLAVLFYDYQKAYESFQMDGISK